MGIWQGVAWTSLGSTRAHHALPCGWATPVTALHMFQGLPTCRGHLLAGVAHLQGSPTWRVGGLLPSFTPLDTPTVCLWEKNTVFGVFAMSENFVNQNCAFRKVVTSSTHGPGRVLYGYDLAISKSHRPYPSHTPRSEIRPEKLSDDSYV
jgi:hypothetical protein